MKFPRLILISAIAASVLISAGCMGSRDVSTIISAPLITSVRSVSVSHPKPGGTHGKVSEVIKRVETTLLGETAKCVDGHISHHRSQKTCSHHGGVAEWY